MRKLLEVLEDYANEALIPQILQTTKHYKERLAVEQHWEDFRATLTEAQCEALEAVLDEDSLSQGTINLALFRAGISIGMELSSF